MPVPTKILDLVDRFHHNLEAYRAGQYNETQVRREFIDPFLKALGWDVDNEAGYAEAYKDVVHEDAIRVGEGVKAPDYACRIGGQRKFFVEAKKPAVNIKEDIHPAYQLRRYAWSAKLPLSILTDFEEFAVYDCRVKPEKTDKASAARLMYFRFTDYAEKWEEIAGIFSPEAIRKGSFDRFAHEKKAQRGTAEVDTAFLQEISNWRDELAANIALRNKERRLKSRDLSFAVQSTIDRLIFLRIAEDRGIEPYGKLRDIATGKDIYPRLADIFRLADARYNSGLFHFKEEKGRDNASLDNLTLSLTIDDRVLKGIIGRLYYPDSPYQFDVIPADILGQVYEQFLGKVIRLTVKGQAKVEEKPEVKKAGGVYYTPTYIVQYIVQQTVGKLLQTSEISSNQNLQTSEVSILDPACGSGSFLLGAYQFLLDWYLGQYGQQPDKWRKGKNPRIFDDGKGNLRLTIGERKRILLAHIYGVDIDPQAVEVTKLSLLLKVLEGETAQTLGAQMALLPERVLPDLSRNIQCGNSLIGPDFYDGQQLGLAGIADEEEFYRINAFDWQAAFPQVMGRGGFEVVIGNPPYVRQELLGDFKGYFEKSYQVSHGVADLYVYFIEKGMQLLKPDGLFAYIVANKWMRANYGKSLRQWLKKQHIVEILDFGDLPVFQQATTYPCILTLAKQPPLTTFGTVQVDTLQFDSLQEYVQKHHYPVGQNNLSDEGWALANEGSTALLEKLNHIGIKLKQYPGGEIYYGVKTGLNEAFVVDREIRNELIFKDPKSAEILKPFLAGRDIKRYQPLESDKFLIFTRRGIDIRQYLAIEQYLSQFKDRLMPRPATWKGESWPGRKPGPYQWYEIQDTVAYYQEFERPKIIIPAIIKSGSYTFDNQGFYSNDKTSIIPTDDYYLLGLLNSKVLDFVIHSIASTKQGGYFEYKPMYVQQLPIRVIDFSNPQDVKLYEQVVHFVKTILNFHQRLAEAHTAHEKTLLQRQIAATDRQIDQLVYQLYHLTPEEIALVEGN